MYRCDSLFAPSPKETHTRTRRERTRIMSDSEGESCDGYDSAVSDEEQPNSEDKSFIASSSEDSASDWESDDQQRRDAEVFHQEAIDAVRAMRQRRRSRRKKHDAMEMADEEVRAGLSRSIQRPAKRRCISSTGNRWTKQWWKKEKKEVKEKKPDFVTCAHASCPRRVRAGTLYCNTHGYNARLKKKVFSRKKSVVKKKKRLEDLKEAMRIFNRYEDLKKRAFPTKTKASSCAKCGQRRVGLFYCSDHSQMECLRKRLGGATRETIQRDLEAVRSAAVAAAAGGGKGKARQFWAST